MPKTLREKFIVIPHIDVEAIDQMSHNQPIFQVKDCVPNFWAHERWAKELKRPMMRPIRAGTHVVTSKGTIVIDGEQAIELMLEMSPERDESQFAITGMMDHLERLLNPDEVPRD